MAQVSIPSVAYFPLEDQPTRVDPILLANAVHIPPEQYLDDDHHGAIYCPDCGVMCSRKPRKLAKRVDNVDAFYAHIKGFDGVICPHRKPGGSGGADGVSKEKKAVNLVTFAGWKSLDDDEQHEDDPLEQPSKQKRLVQGGSAGNGRGGEIVFDANGILLNAGEFHTVRRLVLLAQKSLDISVQFDDQDATRLRDLIVWTEKVEKNPSRYIGKSFLFFGQPTSIRHGTHRVFFNFASHAHHLTGHCDPRIFEKRGWKTFERSHYYIFYGLVQGTEERMTVRILESGQIDRLPVSAHETFKSLR